MEKYIDALASTTNPNNITVTALKNPISDQRDHIIKLRTICAVDSKTPLLHSSKWFDKNGIGECKRLEVDTLQENYMLVTRFDQTNRIISGVFKATMTNPDCPQDTIRLTEGRFDLPYRD